MTQQKAGGEAATEAGSSATITTEPIPVFRTLEEEARAVFSRYPGMALMEVADRRTGRTMVLERPANT